MEKSRIQDKHPGSATLQGTGRYANVPLQKSGYVANRRKSDGNRSILETPDREARPGPSILSGTLGTAADNAQFYSGSRFLTYRVCLKQCSGSMTFWCGSGSGSPDPCLWLMDPDLDPDPDPSIFIIDLQDTNRKRIFLKMFFCIVLF